MYAYFLDFIGILCVMLGMTAILITGDLIYKSQKESSIISKIVLWLHFIPLLAPMTLLAPHYDIELENPSVYLSLGICILYYKKAYKYIHRLEADKKD